MTSNKPRYTTALFFILLLAGAEGARIRSQVTLKATQASQSDADATSLSVAVESSAQNLTFGRGRDVCRLKDFKKDPSLVLSRYHEKMQRLKAASEKLNDHPYSGTKWRSVTRRLRRLSSCSRMLHSKYASEIPDDLKDAMMTGEDQLESGLLAPREAVTKILDEYDAFPIFEGLEQCSFGLMRLDLVALRTSGTPDETLRQQLFGAECSEEETQDYIERLNGKSRRIAKTMHNQLLKVMKLRRSVETAKAEGNEDSADLKAQAEDIADGINGELADVADEAAEESGMINEEELDSDTEDALDDEDDVDDDEKDALDEVVEEAWVENEVTAEEDAEEVDEVTAEEEADDDEDEVTAEEDDAVELELEEVTAEEAADDEEEVTAEDDEEEAAYTVETQDQFGDEEETVEDEDAVAESLLEVSKAPREKKHGRHGKKGRDKKERGRGGRGAAGRGEKTPGGRGRKSRNSRGSRKSAPRASPLPPINNKAKTGWRRWLPGNKYLRIAVITIALIIILMVVFIFCLHIYAAVAGVQLFLYGPLGGLVYSTAWLR